MTDITSSVPSNQLRPFPLLPLLLMVVLVLSRVTLVLPGLLLLLLTAHVVMCWSLMSRFSFSRVVTSLDENVSCENLSPNALSK